MRISTILVTTAAAAATLVRPAGPVMAGEINGTGNPLAGEGLGAAHANSCAFSGPVDGNGAGSPGPMPAPVGPKTTYRWVKYLAAAGAALGLIGLTLALVGFLDSCGPDSLSTGQACYSPPWATPILRLGIVLVVAAILGLATAGLGYVRARRSQPPPPRT